MLRSCRALRCRRLSYARSARSFLGRNLPCRPVGGTLSTSGKSSAMSLRFAAVRVTARGVPRPSQITWCLEPGRRRSTGEGPVFSPPLWPAHASCPPQRGTSPAAPGLATRPAALGAGAPRPPLRSSPAAAASTSSPTRTPSLAADPPTGCPSSARTGCPSAPADRAPACAPDTDTDARPAATTARPEPTTHH